MRSPNTSPPKQNPPEETAAAALLYAEMGWEIFPAPPGRKKSYKSATFNGGRRWGATADPTEVKRDFRRWSRAGIGIPTGEVNGIFVVEADTVEGHGVDGLASVRDLEAEYGPLPDTLAAVSPSGSVHWYFRHPGVPIQTSSSKIAPGVDVLGEGAMVLAPPSVRPGKGRYEWLNWGTSIANAPQWLIGLVEKKEARPRVPSTDVAADEDDLAYALSVIPNTASTDWEQWNRIGMSLWRATGGSDGGFTMFDAWSQKSPRYDKQNTARKWRTYASSPPTSIGAGTIFFLADQADRRWRDAAEIAAWRKLWSQ